MEWVFSWEANFILLHSIVMKKLVITKHASKELKVVFENKVIKSLKVFFKEIIV